MNFNVLKYGTAVLASITLGTAVFYSSQDRTRVKTEDIVELAEACAERALVTAGGSGTRSITITCGNLTNTFSLPVYDPSTNLVITSVPIMVNVGTNLYRDSDGSLRHYVNNSGTILVTNTFITTGKFFRADVPFSVHQGRSMTFATNMSSTYTNIEVQDNQIIGATNVANAVGIFNSISLLQWVDDQIYAMIPRFVDHTKKYGGTYDSWFTNVSMVIPPMWTQSNIFQEAGVGSNAFFSPINAVGITVSNLFERYKVLSLLQETYSDGLCSNRYEVTFNTQEYLLYDGTPPVYISYEDDYFEEVKEKVPWAFLESDYSISFESDWGAEETSEYRYIYYYHLFSESPNGFPISYTNLTTYPLYYLHYRQILIYGGGYFRWFFPGFYKVSLNSMPEVRRDEIFKGKDNGEIFRQPNYQAQGIIGDVDFYVRRGVINWPFLGIAVCNTCYKVGGYYDIDGSQYISESLSYNPLDLDISATRYFDYKTNTYYTTTVYYRGETKDALDSCVFLTGPVITKWNFTKCVPP